MIQYHDREWGVPVHDDRKHFEFLLLEGAQAGLSWMIVLKKREGYRSAFDGFDPEKVARFSAQRIEKLALNPEIIRNRMKIEAAVHNAAAFLKIREEFGSFDSYCWRFVYGRPKLNRWKTMQQIPATSHESDSFSKDRTGHGWHEVSLNDPKTRRGDSLAADLHGSTSPYSQLMVFGYFAAALLVQPYCAVCCDLAGGQSLKRLLGF